MHRTLCGMLILGALFLPFMMAVAGEEGGKASPPRFMCPECGYAAPDEGNCPVCNLSLVEAPVEESEDSDEGEDGDGQPAVQKTGAGSKPPSTGEEAGADAPGQSDEPGLTMDGVSWGGGKGKKAPPPGPAGVSDPEPGASGDGEPGEGDESGAVAAEDEDDDDSPGITMDGIKFGPGGGKKATPPPAAGDGAGNAAGKNDGQPNPEKKPGANINFGGTGLRIR